MAKAEADLMEGGIIIGSVLVNNNIISSGHNLRGQQHSAIFHTEMDALEDAGRMSTSKYTQSV